MDKRTPLNPDIPLTPNEGHGIGTVSGSLDSHNTSGMDATAIVIPNDGPNGPSVKEFPSQNS